MIFARESFNAGRFRREIAGINKKVPLINGKYARYVNLDNAASTPALRPVLDKLNEFMEWYSSVHRGTGFKSYLSTYLYDKAHETVAEFVNADLSNNTVIFVKNTTEAINKLSYRLSLSKEDVVITTMMEHHSNDLPWRSKAHTVYARVDEKGALDYNDLEYKIKQYKDRLKLVAVTGASNVTGYKIRIHDIAAMAHSAGAPVFVDGAQLVPHSPIDMKPDYHPEHIDYLAFSAHKMYAPFGTGVLIGPRKTFEKGDPEYTGGGTVDIVTHQKVRWTGLPDKEEAGSPNVVGAVALAETIKLLKKYDMAKIEEYEKEITGYALKRLKEIEGITLFGEDNPCNIDNRVGVIAFNLDNLPHSLVAAALAWEGGIAVRNGCFCAHPYIIRLLGLSSYQVARLEKRIKAGDRGNLPGMVRISIAAYNNIRDIDRAVETLLLIKEMAKTGELHRKYILSRNDGTYYPADVKMKLDKFYSIG